MSLSVADSTSIINNNNVQAEIRRTELGQESFLRLMAEQLKHQDPLKPLASTEFLGQLAQFSTVKGIEDLQISFRNIASAIGSDQTLQGASMIGRYALVPADHAQLDETGVVDGTVFAEGPGTLTVEISNSQGQLVRRIEVNATAAGDTDFHWDGKDSNGNILAPGDYQLKANYQTATGTVATSLMVAARVNSVSLFPEGLVLNLAGLGSVPLSAVRRVA